MKEEFLHFVWNTRSFDRNNLKTTQGHDVEIMDFGMLNNGGGPDFKNARIRINGMYWAGNVEMHLVASEWDRHRHSSDPKYESVILHVVLEEDQPVILNGHRLPCIELKGRIPASIFRNYQRLLATRAWVPCERQLHGVQPLLVEQWVARLLVERLEEKIETLQRMLGATANDWREVFFRTLIRSFGLGSNRQAFARLARIVPFKAVILLQGKTTQLEALLFGCAGMLNRIFIDAYPASLQREFYHLSNKHGLPGLNAHTWEWGRVRPGNFPTIRIAQLAAMLSKGLPWMDAVLQEQALPTLRKQLEVTASEYWTDHVDFDRQAKPRVRSMGSSTVDVLLINAVVPFLFCYGRERATQQITERALGFMEAIAPEKNAITRKWAELAVPNTNAGQSQGLIHLKRAYCDKHRCAACAIGKSLLVRKE